MSFVRLCPALCFGICVEETKTYLRGYCYTNRKRLLDYAEVFACSWLLLLFGRPSTSVEDWEMLGVWSDD